MLETLLKPNTGASLSGCVRWTQPMDGVRVCDFDCALTVPPALPAEPSEVPCGGATTAMVLTMMP